MFHLSFIHVVPSPVRNLTRSFNGTHITFVTWEAPEFPRGEVNYTVVIQERDLLTDATDVIAMYEVVELEVMVDYPVEAYSEYTINVTSQTRAGEGDTVTTMFQTPEESKLVLAKIKVSRSSLSLPPSLSLSLSLTQLLRCSASSNPPPFPSI